MGRRGSTGATLHNTADEFQAATAQWLDDNSFGGQGPGTMPTGGVGTGGGRHGRRWHRGPPSLALIGFTGAVFAGVAGTLLLVARHLRSPRLGVNTGSAPPAEVSHTVTARADQRPRVRPAPDSQPAPREECMTTNTPARTRPASRLFALVVGVTFLLVGVLGFVPGVTTSYDQLSLAGHESGALLLGLFAVSVLHNLVHLAFGVAGVLMARTTKLARAYLIGGGIIYAVLWVYGLVIDQDSAANFVPVNTADNWLHLGLAVGMIALGVLGGALDRGAHSANSSTPRTATT